jgi:arylsulfatase A-like enzyme
MDVRPKGNVLLIVADQWRGEALGCLGHPAVRTPNIDALAADGVMFRNYYGQSAPCGPARASMLTGLYVMNHRAVANGVPLDARHANIATELRRAGIDPAMIGYTTTTPDPRLAPRADPRYREMGAVMEGFRVVAHLDEVEFRSYLGWVKGRGYALPEGDPLDLWAPAEGPPGPTSAPCRVPAALSDTAWTGEHGLAFLREASPHQPWLLHLGFFRPHPPFAAPAPYHMLVPLEAIPPPLRAASAEEEAAEHPMLAHWLRASRQSSYFQGADGPISALDDHAIAQVRRAYYGLIAEIDDWIGRVVAELRRSGQWDDTLVIFTSDHGEQLGDHRMLGKRGWFDQSYHLPLIVRDPRRRGGRGRVVDAFAESVDLMPTILDWFGLPVPGACDGVSLLPWFDGATPAAWRDAVHFEYDLRGGWPAPTPVPGVAAVGPQAGAMAAIRTARWKYVHFAELPPVLYDLANDPGEMRNVAGDPAHRGLLAEAMGRMLDWRLRHGARAYTDLCATPEGLAPR